jgi:hypothetical protein
MRNGIRDLSDEDLVHLLDLMGRADSVEHKSSPGTATGAQPTSCQGTRQPEQGRRARRP